MLAVAPDALGTVFDLQSGLVGTDRFLSDRGVRDRCDLVAGSFFDAVLPAPTCMSSARSFTTGPTTRRSKSCRPVAAR